MSKDIIAITRTKFNDDEVNAVDARELHAFLEVGRDLSSWIKARIEEYNFVEGSDFVSSTNSEERVGRPSIDYTLSIDMAKELAMVERNEKGREARHYFIEAEKRLKEYGLKVAEIKAIEAKLMDMKKSILDSIQVNYNEVYWENDFPTKYCANRTACFMLPKWGDLIVEVNQMVEAEAGKNEILSRITEFVTEEMKAMVEKAELYTDFVQPSTITEIQEIHEQFWDLLTRMYELLNQGDKAGRFKALISKGDRTLVIPHFKSKKNSKSRQVKDVKRVPFGDPKGMFIKGS